MSLKENGTNAHARGLAQQPNSLRKPMAKSPAPDMESFMTTNGPKDPSASNSGMAWPIKNPSLMAPSAPGENACWSNRLFDLDALKSLSLTSTSTTPNPNDGLWQSLNKNNIITDENNTNVKDIASTPKGVDRMYSTNPLPVTPTSSVVGAASGGAWSSVVGSKATNGIVQAPPGFNKHQTTTTTTCSSCEDKPPAIAHCHDCRENLCETCVGAHRRVSMTKAHHITNLLLHGVAGPSGATLESLRTSIAMTHQASPMTSSAGGGINRLDRQPVLMMNRGLGQSLQSEVMEVYKGAVDKAKVECPNLISDSSKQIALMDETKTRIEEVKTRVEVRYGNVKSEIVTMTRNYMAAIQQRESILLKRLDDIRKVKMDTLNKQSSEISNCRHKLKTSIEALKSLNSANGREVDLVNATAAADASLKEIQRIMGSATVHEDDIIQFVAPNPELMKAMNSLAIVGGSGFAQACRADGDGLKKAILGRDARFHVLIKDQLGEQRSSGGDNLNINIIDPEGRQLRYSINDMHNGMYRVIWKPIVEGEHNLSITLKDCHIHQSPFKVSVRSGRNYKALEKPLLLFGEEGENDGNLCRPWGICCSRDGLILAANRSNNRIEVFDKLGKFLYNFGKAGKGNGEFERPASVTCDRMNRVIVTDKDNHRIQIFTIKGEFLQTFGQKGSKNGEFNYPWDVACNSRDCILVSDTRNHRIQLFDPNGQFVAKYGFEGREWKHFDSPRGVCFAPDDQIVVTDFNNHRLLVVAKDFSAAQYLGKEGTEDGMFTRPNGVAVDEEGNIIVADSRNDRIQVFSSSGTFLTKFGVKGTAPGEFDRPSGICISPEGIIIVVDFGNNRVQMF